MKEKWTPHIIAVTTLVVFIVLGLACASSPESDASETADKHFEQGKAFDEKQDYFRAIMEYTEAINLNPNFVDAYTYRARARILAGGNQNPAEADCNKAIELDPQKPSPYYFRGLIYQGWGKAESYYLTNTESLSKALEYYNHSLSDFNKALELSTNSNNQQFYTRSITEAKAEKEKIETNLASSKARDATNKYDKSKFIIVPETFYPADYTKADLFDAVATSEKLDITPKFWMGNTPVYPSKDFVSEVLFVSQNGTDITFRTADNAIRKAMKVDSRTGLTADQKVRIYYTVYRIKDWTITAIERM